MGVPYYVKVDLNTLESLVVLADKYDLLDAVVNAAEDSLALWKDPSRADLPRLLSISVGLNAKKAFNRFAIKFAWGGPLDLPKAEINQDLKPVVSPLVIGRSYPTGDRVFSH